MTHSEIFDYSSFKYEAPPKGLNFGVVGLAHSHIYPMCEGLIKAGAILKCVFEENEKLLIEFKKRFPEVTVCRGEEELLSKSDISLVVSAAIPGHRADIAVRAMEKGKNVLVDKAPATTLKQIEKLRKIIEKTGKRYFVYYGESIDNEGTLFAYDLVRRGVIGKVKSVVGTAPHLLNAASRPDWFFKRETAGGILTDLVCHQVHQFLKFAKTKDAQIEFAKAENINHPEYPEFDESGEIRLKAQNGIKGQFKVDWNFPEGLGTWGDPKITVTGENGSITVLKNCNLGKDLLPNQVFVSLGGDEFHEIVTDKFTLPFFSNVIKDCIKNTHTANCAETDLTAAEIAVKAQEEAMKNGCHKK